MFEEDEDDVPKQPKRDITHAPDLLDGPSHSDEGIVLPITLIVHITLYDIIPQQSKSVNYSAV